MCIPHLLSGLLLAPRGCKAEPGSILRMTAGRLTAGLCRSVSLHKSGLVETIIMAEQLGCTTKEVVILGVKPKDLSCGIGLSPEVAAAPKVVKLILDGLSE